MQSLVESFWETLCHCFCGPSRASGKTCAIIVAFSVTEKSPTFEVGVLFRTKKRANLCGWRAFLNQKRANICGWRAFLTQKRANLCGWRAFATQKMLALETLFAPPALRNLETKKPRSGRADGRASECSESRAVGGAVQVLASKASPHMRPESK